MQHIVFFGAGSIGSLFAAKLANRYPDYTISVVGRKDHVDAIKKNGLRVSGESDFCVKVPAFESIDEVPSKISLLFLCVKNYQTEEAVVQIKDHLSKECVIVSLQNGLSHLEVLKQNFEDHEIVVGVTSHGAQKLQPGVIEHTGIGFTTIGNLTNASDKRLSQICTLFSESKIVTSSDVDIVSILWKKAIINSSINPITAFLEVENGQLANNPILKDFVSAVCAESCAIARARGFDIEFDSALDKTFEVIAQTKKNKSSMLQCVLAKKKTEIESINGVFVSVGSSLGIDAHLNSLLMHLIMEKTKGFF